MVVESMGDNNFLDTVEGDGSSPSGPTKSMTYRHLTSTPPGRSLITKIVLLITGLRVADRVEIRRCISKCAGFVAPVRPPGRAFQEI